MAVSTTAIAAAKPRVRRTRIGSRLTASVRAQPVTHAPHRLDRVQPEGAVDLLTEVANVDVDHVGAALESDVPGPVEQLGTAERDSRAAHEQLEHRELLRRQVELLLASPRAVGGGIEAEVADL